MAAKPKRAAARKVVLEFNVLDAATKKRLSACIARRGKVTVTAVHRATVKGARDGGGFDQRID
jgi:hypothetical protein